jgi:hypothetical protein
MSTLQSLAGASRIPGPHDKVYKDECFFSFDSPVIACLKKLAKLFRDEISVFGI